MTKKSILCVLCLLCTLCALCQNADKLYEEGKSLYDAKNYTAAFPKLKAAAEKGHKKAQYRLGRCYDKGNGVAENDEEAFKWYSKSAAQNYGKALYQVGKCYKDGEGVEKNHQKAFEFFTKASKQDNAEAKYQLAKYYLKGKHGIKTDPAKAKSLLKQAVSDEKDGRDILDKMRKDAAEEDEDSKKLLEMAGK